MHSSTNFLKIPYVDFKILHQNILLIPFYTNFLIPVYAFKMTFGIHLTLAY